MGNPPCTTQSPSVNVPSSPGFNDYECSTHATAGHLHGHLNWWAATASGTIFWHDHKDWTQIGDDDYDLRLIPSNARGLTTNNPNDTPGAVQAYEVEFDSDETVDHIDRGWWNDFHKAVDSNAGKTGGPAGAMIDGHEAIVIGLMGLDSEHGAYSELHPVYGLAIHVKDDLQDDTWALLVRNWGDEGFCSQDEMAVPLTALSFFLPRAGATGGTANTDQLFSNNDNTVAVLTQPGGAVVSVDLGPPESGTLIHGTVHFSWTMSARPSAPRRPIPGSAIARVAGRPQTAVEKPGPDEDAAALLQKLPADKKAEVQAKLQKPPAAAYTRPVRRVAQIKVARVAQRIKPTKLPATAKAARDRQRLEILCSAFGGQIPGYPANLCQATH